MRTQNNKWKVGFWIYFAISIIVIIYLFAKNNIDEVNLAFTKINKIQTELDLQMISEIVNKTDLSITEILSEIESNKLSKIENTKNNNIELERIILIFENEKLVKIEHKKRKWIFY